jgi:hypothetical protein
LRPKDVASEDIVSGRKKEIEREGEGVITSGKSGTKGGCLAYDVWMVLQIWHKCYALLPTTT